MHMISVCVCALWQYAFKQFETENEPFNVVDNGDVLRFLLGRVHSNI